MTRSLDMEHAELLAGVELFAGLDRVMLAKLAAHLQSVPLEAGAVLFHEGDPGDAFYLVSKGAFGVYTAGPEGVEDRRVAVLRAGQRNRRHHTRDFGPDTQEAKRRGLEITPKMGLPKRTPWPKRIPTSSRKAATSSVSIISPTV